MYGTPSKSLNNFPLLGTKLFSNDYLRDGDYYSLAYKIPGWRITDKFSMYLIVPLLGINPHTLYYNLYRVVVIVSH